MPDDWDERDDVVAAGSICPAPDCGALVVSYRSPDRAGHDNAKLWCEFTCSRCGVDFAVSEDELIFQIVPKVLPQSLLVRQGALPRQEVVSQRRKLPLPRLHQMQCVRQAARRSIDSG
jgi:hypothetical protein